MCEKEWRIRSVNDKHSVFKLVCLVFIALSLFLNLCGSLNLILTGELHLLFSFVIGKGAEMVRAWLFVSLFPIVKGSVCLP